MVIEVIEEINRGGFGIVEKVRLSDGTVVARKTFSPISLASLNDITLKKFRDRFIREVKTQKHLPDEYFIPILDYDLEATQPWFLMPLAEKDFKQEIELNVENPLDNVGGLSDILNSLEQLHEYGLVHRDLKPQNVLFQDGKWKLSDLGLISSDKEILSLSITSTDSGYGTVLYCAPEQVHDFKRVTESADIYSFGAILHDVFGNGSRTPYSRLKAKGPIGYVIEKCTEEKPEHRFNSVSSLRSAFLSILAKFDSEKPAPDVQDLVEKMNDALQWNDDEFEAFYISLSRIEDDISLIFFEINMDMILHFSTLDKGIWENFSLKYFSWINERSFSFEYCDVLVGRIKKISDLSTSVDVKAKAVTTGISLGSRHNRWYVMRIMVTMANSTIPDNLAFRISIEIHVGGFRLKNYFKACVSRISNTVDSYHPIIKDAIIL